MKYVYAQATLLIAAAVWSQAIGAQGLTRVERPAINVGDTWVYQSRDAQTGEKRPGWRHVVSEVTPDRIMVRSAKSQLSFTQDFNLIEIKTGETVTVRYTPAWGYYNFPLEVGKTYDAKFQSDSRSGTRDTRWNWKAEVLGSESVTVPAGTYDALKIKYTGNYNVTEAGRSWSGGRIETLWYAPAVNRHVKTEWTHNWSGSGFKGSETEVNELVSYTPAK